MTNKNPTNETPILIEKFLAENSKINDADTVIEFKICYACATLS